jgi:hypothetical protein
MMYLEVMTNTLSFVSYKTAFACIPMARRHLYFYTLLLLTAVMLSNMKEAVLGNPATTIAKAKRTASRIVGERAVQSLK